MSFKAWPLSKLPLNAIVEAWLHDVQLATSPTQHHQDSSCLKRSLSPCPSPSGKRVALATAQGNIMASPKRQADESPEDAGTPKRHQIPIHLDDTPRARPGQRNDHSLTNYPPLEYPGQPSSLLSDSLTRSSVSQRSRSSSLVKNLGALWLTDSPVERSDKFSEMPSSGRELCKELLRCAASRGVMPSALQNEITTAIDEMDYLADSMFDSALTSYLDHSVELAKVQEIMRTAKKCQELEDAEPGWNEQVHCRVLKLALGKQGSVDFQNITTAKIHPAAFKPKTLKGMSLSEKMANYTICLESDSAEPMFNQMRSNLRFELSSSQYINHTSFEPVRYRPIAVSIGTKVAGNEADTIIQLSVWVVAHFKRLQVIMQRSGVCSEMTVLPLIDVQGHDWIITLAVQRESKTTLYGRMRIGTTESILGIYKILAALRVLRRWADTVFRTWFNTILVSAET